MHRRTIMVLFLAAVTQACTDPGLTPDVTVHQVDSLSIDAKLSDRNVYLGPDHRFHYPGGRLVYPLERVLDSAGITHRRHLIDDRIYAPAMSAWYRLQFSAPVDRNKLSARLRSIPDIQYADPVPWPPPPPPAQR
jgi:hypothetical protein